MTKSDGDKRPSTAYFQFSNAKRDEYKKKYPELKVTEIAKKLGAAWKEMDEKEKDPYVRKAKEEKEAYDATHPKVEKVKGDKKGKKSDKDEKVKGKEKGKDKKSKKDDDKKEKKKGKDGKSDKKSSKKK